MAETGAASVQGHGKGDEGGDGALAGKTVDGKKSTKWCELGSPRLITPLVTQVFAITGRSNISAGSTVYIVERPSQPLTILL